MSTEIKNTLFRFVSMRAPELSSDIDQNLRFVFRSTDLPSQFDGVITENIKLDAFKQIINTEEFEPATKDNLKTELDNAIYLFSVWLAKNKIGYRKTELAEKISPAIAVVKPNGQLIDLDTSKTILWDNLFYQVVTHKDFYAKELAMQLLHALHVIENYEEGNHAKNALLMKACVVLPKEFFVDEVSEETNTTFSTLSTEPRVALLPNRIMQKQHMIAYTEDENEQLEKLKVELKKASKEYQKEYSLALNEAQDAYQLLIKSDLDAHKLAVKESLQNWCSVRDPQLEYNPKDPCSSPPVVPEPELDPFDFTFRNEVDIVYLRDNEILSEDSLQLLETLTGQNDLQARGPVIAGLNFVKKSFLEDTDSFDKALASIDSLIANNKNLIVENTEMIGNKKVSLGGVLIPVSNHNAIANPFEYELSTHTLITGQERAMLSFEVPDSSWEVESFSYDFEIDYESHSDLVSQSSRIGNHIILRSLPLGKIKTNGEAINHFGGEIRFSNGITKNFTIGSLTPGNVLIGQLINPVQVDIDGNDGFVPTGFGMKQLGIADYKRVEQSVHCYVEGEVAHIENIMAREYKEKSTRRLRKSENTTTSSSESEREKLTDTTSTERYDMQSEVAKVIQQANDFSAGTQFSSEAYKVKFGGHADFATHNSKEESTRQSVAQAKEITEKALDRIVNKVKEERIEKIVEEYEENNKHGFDNTQGDKHVVGVYRWVDKLYKNKVINYGKRLMFEFMIPQPGKLHTLGMAEGLDKESTEMEEPQDPRTFQKDLNTFKNGLNLFGGSLNLKDYSKVNDVTLKYWASKYNVEINSMPTTSLSVGKEFSFDSLQRGETSMSWSGKESLTIPDGYKAIDASVSVSGAAMSGGNWAPYLGASVGNLKFYRGYGVNENANLDKQGNDTMEHYEKNIPVSVFAITQHVGIFNVSVKCELTAEAKQKWQQENFKAIIDAYEDALAVYKVKEEAEKQKASTIKGTNPGFYRQIENTILRKNCISYMIDRRPGARKTYGLNDMASGDKFTNYEVNLNQNLDNYAAFVKFMEQAFEWDLMSYNLYPFYWGSKTDWASLYQYDESNDPLFRNFMQSGMARVVATVRPGFEEVVRYFLQTGKIWNGGEVPLIHDELFLSIVEELDEQEGKQEGKAWITRLPTSLTILQADSIGLKVEKALPCNCDDEINDETYENPEDALCSSEITQDEGQTLAGSSSAKAQNNITRVVRVAYYSEGTNVQTQILNAVNTGLPYPIRFTILEDEDYIITASPQFSSSVEGYVTPVFKYKVVNIGKNKTGEHYGFGGIQLTADNLELIYSNEPAVNDYLDNPRTQLVDLGWDITGTTTSAFINNLEESVDFQEQEDGYVIVKVIDNDEPKTYFFTGQGGSYGIAGITAQETDFLLLEGDSENSTSAIISTLPPSGIPAEGQEWIIYNDNI